MADLSAFQGQLAQLIFRVVGGDQESLPVGWVTPKLYGSTADDMDVDTSVVLIVIDTLRSDVLGSYGGAGGHSPHMDELAASGVRFERAYSHIPITVPSHSSMFTSLLPTEHAALNNGHVLNASHVTLAERLRDDTYRRTSAFVSLGVLKAHFGVAQGFDEYYDTFGRDWWKTAEEINGAVLPWLADRDAAEPFFLWAHYSDPHEPYSPPGRDYPELIVRTEDGIETSVIANGSTWRVPLDVEEDTTRVTVSSSDRLEWPIRLNGLRTNEGATVTCEKGCRERSPAPGIVEYAVVPPASFSIEHPAGETKPAWIQFRPVENLPPSEIRVRYLEEVEYVDRAIGELVIALRERGDNPLIILTADHGEELGEHGGAGHVTRLYDTTLRVPLIFSWPGVLPEGVVVEDPVSHIDLLPTIFELLKIPDTETRSGRSLVPQLLARPGVVEPRPIVAETFRPESRKDRQAIDLRDLQTD